jgi:homoserine dehydrogenase
MMEAAVTQHEPDQARGGRKGGPCRVVLAGFGTVGRSVARVLDGLRDDARLVAVLDRRAAIKRAGWLHDPDVVWTDSIDEALAGGADVFIELIGGIDPAESWIREALSRRVSVVTANKQVIAHAGPSLLSMATSNGCQLRFEASVAGGVPVLRAIESGLAGDRLVRVAGILNGTCNYILTRMEREGVDFASALKEAQALGFAEADPTMDIGGGDARAKLAILAMIALGVQAPVGGIHTESIASVTPLDFQYARRLGCTIRQVAWASRGPADANPGGAEGLEAGVGPALVPLDAPLARVSGSENLVTVRGQFGGETSFGGRGAGGDPTAVAVVSDVLGIARGARPPLRPTLTIVDEVSDDLAAPFYVRFTVRDRPGIIAALATVFADYAINIDAILQEPGFPADARPFVISLDAAPAGTVHAALEKVAGFDFHVAPPVAMPILGTMA